MSDFLAEAVKSDSGRNRLIHIMIVTILLLVASISTILLVVSALLFEGGGTISVSGTTFVFQNKKEHSTFLIHPRGWQTTKLSVEKNDKVKIDASGSINVALYRLIQAVEKKYEIQLDIEATGEDPSPKHFSETQLKKIQAHYPWNGPMGISGTKKDANSSSARLYNSANLGQLLAVVIPKGDEVPKSTIRGKRLQVIPLTENTEEFKVRERGYLYFVVNDNYFQRELASNVELQDNLGFFSVRVYIERAD